MKSLLFSVCCVLSCALTAQVVYVDAANTTPGDGTSWDAAYTNLNDALLAAPAGSSVWIAAGTYVTPDSASFFIDKELTVLGGFAGDETDAAAADPSANETILSGDVMGNDPAMGFDSTAFDDNNRVLFVTDTAATSRYTVTLDGLTLTNGAVAQAQGDGDFNDFTGGGLRAYARVNASRLKFTRNYARSGAAIFLRFGNSSNSVFDSIEVVDNHTADFRVIYVRDNDGVSFTNSDFQGEGSDVLSGSGIFRVFNATNFTISGSSFSEVQTDAAGGIGLFTNTLGGRFINNTATDLESVNSNAGLLVNTSNGFGPDVDRTVEDFIIADCTFDGMTAAGWGASVYGDNTNMAVRNCTIINALTGRNGAAIYWQADSDNAKDDYLVEVSGCHIEDNEGGAFGGATAFLYFDTVVMDLTIDDTEIIDNISNNGRGGAMYYQAGIPGGSVSITNSEVLENFGESGAFVVNADVDVTATNTKFNENGDPNNARRGGAMTFFMAEGSIAIDSCEFVDNIITTLPAFSAGGAFYLFAQNNPGKNLPLSVTNSLFRGNAAGGTAPGGAMYVSFGTDFTVENTDFINNTSGSIGGAFHGRTFEVDRDTLEDGTVDAVILEQTGRFKNCRFITNAAAGQGGAVGTFRAAYDFENCVFADNSVGNDGNSGGAIIFNGLSTGFLDSGDLFLTGDLNLESTMINNTFVDNLKGNGEAPFGSSIALFQNGPTVPNGDSSSITLRLLNNAFLNSDEEPSIELEPDTDVDGIDPIANISVISLGGNFYNTEPGTDIELGDDDILNEDINDRDDVAALFVDIYDENGEGVNADLNIPADLTDNPLINNGVQDTLVPAFDVRGFPRGERPDIGAYEAEQGAVSVGEPLVASGLDISFFPNPTANVLRIRNEEASAERLSVRLYDLQGRVLQAAEFGRGTSEMDLTRLPAGLYGLQIMLNGKVYSQTVVKQ